MDAATQTLDIYVNGLLSNGVLLGTVPTSQSNAAVNVNVGRRTGGYNFNGLIDEVRIFDRALTQAEILAGMNTPLGGSAPITASISESNAPQYSLAVRFPNPRSVSTAMEFLLNLPIASHVKLEAFNVLGRRVAVLVDEYRTGGSYVERYNAAALPSGVYFFRAVAGRFKGVQKVVLVK